MAKVDEHLSANDLEDRDVACGDATAARHFQAIWLLARGHTVSEAAAATAYGERWIEQLLARYLARYNAEGPEARGDPRRRNGASATILKPELPAKLRDRLREPPPGGGLWSRRKVADGMADELGLAPVAPQRGWRAESRAGGQSEAIRASGLSGAAKARQALKAIGWPIRKPRPKNPKSATPEAAAAFKKNSRMAAPRRRQSIPANQSRSSPRTRAASA